LVGVEDVEATCLGLFVAFQEADVTDFEAVCDNSADDHSFLTAFLGNQNSDFCHIGIGVFFLLSFVFLLRLLCLILLEVGGRSDVGN